MLKLEKPAKVIFIIVLVLAAFGSAALAACGTRGGPGYRDSNGKCVGWESLCRVCGSPPETRCTPERVAPGADCQKNQDRKDDQDERMEKPLQNRLAKPQ